MNSTHESRHISPSSRDTSNIQLANDAKVSEVVLVKNPIFFPVEESVWNREEPAEVNESNSAWKARLLRIGLACSRKEEERRMI